MKKFLLSLLLMFAFIAPSTLLASGHEGAKAIQSEVVEEKTYTSQSVTG
jgi:hypothetical protein